MRHALVLTAQVTLADVRNAARGLDIPTFIRQTAALVPYVPDLPTDEDTRLVRALVEVPFGEGNTAAERFAPYVQAGVAKDWYSIILRLRVRGQSALAHPEAVLGADYVCDEDHNLVPAGKLLGARQRRLRPRARTLKVVFERRPGGSGLARVPPAAERAPAPLFNALVAELSERVRLTIGGEVFLAPDPGGRAVSVLVATVAAVLGDRACQRWAGRKRVVRVDAYEGLLDALKLDQYFDVAREILERDHRHHHRISAPWPPGEGVAERDLGILRYDDGYLTLSPDAVLPSLPVPNHGQGMDGAEEGDSGGPGDEG